MKFLTDRTLLPTGSADFRSPEASLQSPLARRLFDLDGVEGVFLCQNFVTVTASSENLWKGLSPRVIEVMREWATSKEAVLEQELKPQSMSDDDVVRRIKEILDTQIRPAVAMDGGDVVFESFDHGLVRLRMQGACGGCPSSTATLKMGIEARLRHFIPQVERVEAV